MGPPIFFGKQNMKEITYKKKPATIKAELSRRNPTLDRRGQVIEPGAVYVQLEIDGREVFDWISYDLLYDAAGKPL
jgi:hypothetical protein